MVVRIGAAIREETAAVHRVVVDGADSRDLVVTTTSAESQGSFTRKCCSHRNGDRCGRRRVIMSFDIVAFTSGGGADGKLDWTIVRDKRDWGVEQRFLAVVVVAVVAVAVAVIRRRRRRKIAVLGVGKTLLKSLLFNMRLAFILLLVVSVGDR